MMDDTGRINRNEKLSTVKLAVVQYGILLRALQWMEDNVVGVPWIQIEADIGAGWLIDVEERLARAAKSSPLLRDPLCGEMKLIHALEPLPADEALPLIAKEAFRSSEDYSHVTSVLAGYRLWDRIAADPTLAIRALDATDIEVANRAEWVLVKGGPGVLPAVRTAIRTSTPAVRERLIRVLAWQSDAAAIPMLIELRHANPQDAELLDWAIHKIEVLNP